MVLALTSLISMSASFSFKYIWYHLLVSGSTEVEHRKTVMIQAFVSSKLDYCNSLLYGLPDKDVSHVSVFRAKLLNWLLKLGKGITYRNSNSLQASLLAAHIQKCTIFQIFLITYKVLNGLTLKYLSDLLNIHQPVRSLRSNVNDNLRLHRPMFKTKNYGSHTF